MNETRYKRRWYQFSLRLLFAVVTLLAIPCWYVGSQYRIVAHRKALRAKIEEVGGFCIGDLPGDDLFSEQLPLIRRWLGDERVFTIHYPLSIGLIDPDELRAAFPESILAFNNPGEPAF